MKAERSVQQTWIEHSLVGTVVDAAKKLAVVAADVVVEPQKRLAAGQRNRHVFHHNVDHPLDAFRDGLAFRDDASGQAVDNHLAGTHVEMDASRVDGEVGVDHAAVGHRSRRLGHRPDVLDS